MPQPIPVLALVLTKKETGIGMKKILGTITAVALSTSLVACTTVAPAPKQAANQNINWTSREASLHAINVWSLRGSIGIRKANEAWSATVAWRQTTNNYVLNIVGPMGAGSARLNGSPSQVTLTDDKGHVSQAATAEELLQRQMGWEMPVANLYYWVRGIPAPGGGGAKRFDRFHHLTSLSQDGWHIEFQRYTAVRGLDLPSKITLSKGDFRIRMVINQWQLPNKA